MNKHAPRLAPLTDDELDPEQEAMIAPLRKSGADYTISRAFVRHPRALKAFNALAGHMFYLENTTLNERQRELAVRLAIGAGRWRIVRQMLVESLVLAAAAVPAALLVAWGSIELLRSMMPAELLRFIPG